MQSRIRANTSCVGLIDNRRLKEKSMNTPTATPITAHPGPIAARLQADSGEALALRVEPVAGVVHVRLRPAGATPGIDTGPRVVMELAPADARRLGLALVATAEGLNSPQEAAA